MGGLICFLKVLPEIEIPGAGDVAHQELAVLVEDRSSESSQLPRVPRAFFWSLKEPIFMHT